MSRDALLTAVAADPDSDLPRLVYADWWDDQGEPDRAEFIRLQCQTARTDPTDPGWLPAKLREFELFARRAAAWSPDDDRSGVRWRRGFPAWAEADTAGPNGRYFVRTERDVLALVARGHPVVGVQAAGLPRRLRAALLGPWGRTVRELHFTGYYSWDTTDPADRDIIGFLSDLPADGWPALRRLDLDWTLTDYDLDAVARAGATAFSLRLVSSNGPGRAACERFAAVVAPRAEALRVVFPGGPQAAGLFAVPWPRLRRLDLDGCPPEVAAVLAQARLPALEHLSYNVTSPGRRGGGALATLARSAVVAGLDSLHLAGWPPAALADFWRGFVAGRLRKLTLYNGLEGISRLPDLSGCPGLHQLRTARFGWVGFRLAALADPDVLPHLHSLTVAQPGLRLPWSPLLCRDGKRTVVAGDDPPGVHVWTADWPD